VLYDLTVPPLRALHTVGPVLGHIRIWIPHMIIVRTISYDIALRMVDPAVFDVLQSWKSRAIG